MGCGPPGSSPWDSPSKEYWSGLPFPSQGIFRLRDRTGSPAFQAGFSLCEPDSPKDIFMTYPNGSYMKAFLSQDRILLAPGEVASAICSLSPALSWITVLFPEKRLLQQDVRIKKEI